MPKSIQSALFNFKRNRTRDCAIFLMACLLFPDIVFATDSIAGKYLCRSYGAFGFGRNDTEFLKPVWTAEHAEYVVTISHVDYPSESKVYIVYVERRGEQRLSKVCQRFEWDDFAGNDGPDVINLVNSALTCYSEWGRFRIDVAKHEFSQLFDEPYILNRQGMTYGPSLDYGYCGKI